MLVTLLLLLVLQAERVIDKLDKLGAVHGDLGLSLFKVAKFEEAEGGPLATSTGDSSKHIAQNTHL